MADVIIGAKLQVDSGDANNSVRNFKKELKDAQAEVVALTDKFGATSEQARAAAKRAAELTDAIGDAKQLTDSFNPDQKFKALGASLNGVLGGFTALTGAMGLLGVESEDVQKQLLKVQSALALSQGLNQIGESIQSFKTLGATIIQTLGKSGAIGLAIAGVTALGLAISGIFNKRQRDDVKAYNETLKDYYKAATQARQTVTEVKIAFEQARAGVIRKDQALKIYNETLGDSLGTTNDINEAERITTEKADDYIKVTALKAQANALFAKAADRAADALIAQDELLKKGPVNIFGVNLTDKANAALEQAKKGAADIQKLGEDLLRQAGELSKKTGINIGGGTVGSAGGRNSQAVKEQKEETEEILLNWSIRKDNVLLRQQELSESLKKNRQELVDFGRTIEQQEFDEKIKLLDLELDIEENATKRKIELAEEERRAKVTAAQSIGNALGALSDLVGKETAAGKVLGIAQATINTFIGATEVLRAKSVLPEPFGTISKIANVAAIIATGLAAVKNIVKTPVPGSYGGGGNIPTTSQVTPLQPQIQNTNTLLNQNQLNQIGNATVRAFVVESDVTNNQERIRRLNRAARI